MVKAIILTLSISLAPSLWAAENDIWIGSYSSSDGQNFQWVVPYQKMKSTPSWHGDFAKLPLGFSKALELSAAYLRKQHPEVDKLELWSINLIKVVSKDPADKWYFALSFLSVKDGKPMMGLSLGTRVLLDGTVVEPIRKKG
jgi:hypothetical protein